MQLSLCAKKVRERIDPRNGQDSFIIWFCFLSDLDTRSEACQRFFRDGLTISFTKILTDEAVNGWKYEIHVC